MKHKKIKFARNANPYKSFLLRLVKAKSRISILLSLQDSGIHPNRGNPHLSSLRGIANAKAIQKNQHNGAK